MCFGAGAGTSRCSHNLSHISTPNLGGEGVRWRGGGGGVSWVFGFGWVVESDPGRPDLDPGRPLKNRSKTAQKPLKNRSKTAQKSPQEMSGF